MLALSEGSVIRMLIVPNPGGTFEYEFFLGGGEQSGNGNYLSPGFGYANGSFALTEGAYTVTGTINQQATNQVIDTNVQVISFSLSNCTLKRGSTVIASNLIGEYSQMMGQSNGVDWSGPGGLVLHS